MKAGDVVQLQSGGPPMTVAGLAGHNYTKEGVGRVVPDGHALGAWFVGTAFFQERFPLESLKPSAEPPTAVPKPEEDDSSEEVLAKAYIAGRDFARDRSRETKISTNTYPAGSRRSAEWTRGYSDNRGY